MTSRGQINQDIVVRFAPSPNGQLHLGHAYAAIAAYDYARERGGRFLLRIEDIDGARSRPQFIDAILEDLRWLGLDWDGPVIYQSRRLESYGQAFEKLREKGLVYRCFCTRKQIAEAQLGQALPIGPDGAIYPGTCRLLTEGEAARRAASEPHCWRLDMAKACKSAGPMHWCDEKAGLQTATPEIFGDVVLMRKDAPASYHLAATVDDAADGISHVVRGQDLFAATHIHRLLQALLDLPTPIYVHHPLLLDQTGQKLAKSRASAPLKNLRDKDQYRDQFGDQSGVKWAEKLRNSKFPIGISLSAP